jgi:hypothetical protein
MSERQSQLTAALVASRNADGGWPYYAGKGSRLEPTAWAALALANTAEGSAVVDTLRRWPRAGDLLLEHAGGIPNYTFHALALLALARASVHDLLIGELLAGLERVKGIAIEGSFGKHQDNSLQGWSWIAETFSWAEPTAWSLLLLKKLKKSGVPVDAARLDHAERLMINRTCATGGWNYGNADVNGQDLRAYVPTTAVGLLGMQDRQDPEILRSVDYLDQHATAEASGHALSLATIALDVWRRDASTARAALDAQLNTTLEIGNCAVIASALMALKPEESHAAFAL